jgi:hypothetical protein
MSRSALWALVTILLAPAIGAWAGPARADNPYGVMLFPNPGEDYALTLARARGLGVTWFRPPTIALQSGSMGAPQAFLKSGLKLAITIRNSTDPSSRAAAGPPADLAAFRKSVDAVLTAWRPSLLVVENEEDQTLTYNAGSEPTQAAQAYGAELTEACVAAHEAKTACTNGGLSTRVAVYLTWLGYLAANEADRACDFARRAIGEDGCKYRSVDQLPLGLRTKVFDPAMRFLDLYRTAPIDFVNFHWFGPDSRAFAETADFLSHATGKPAVTNEFGQRSGADPQLVRPLLRAVIAEQMPLAIWYSLDTANTVSLFGPDGRLRPTGWEFQRQLSGLR